MGNEKIKRGRPRRTWIKLHCDGILRGSINYQLSLEEQAVWMKLLAFTAVCGGQEGWIQDNDQRPLPHFFTASELHCPLEVFENTLTKCIEEGRCRENSQGIEIVNWKYYESEYDRQKPFRDRKKEREADSYEMEWQNRNSIAIKKKRLELERALSKEELLEINEQIDKQMEEWHPREPAAEE